MSRFSVVGLGRAGSSIATALVDVGWTMTETFGRNDDLSGAASDCEVCILATPDDLIAEVSESIDPGEATVVHLSGVTPLQALGKHQNRAGLHPLAALPDVDRGRLALRSAWFAVAGVPDDRVVREIAEALSGRWFPIADEQRALYHAAAAVASNHLVALLGQVERLSTTLGMPVESFLHLAKGALGDVEREGARQALTGPASRGDEATLAEHRDALTLADSTGQELLLYDALSSAARRLAQDQAG